MRDAEIHSKVADVLADTLNVDKHKIEPASKLQTDLGAESIDILEIMFRLENEFGIEIKEAELLPQAPQASRAALQELFTVQMITGYVRQKIRAL